MKPKVLCPRWGRCRAKKKCPLSKEARGKVYVLGPCANKKAKISKDTWFKGWEKAINSLEF